MLFDLNLLGVFFLYFHLTVIVLLMSIAFLQHWVGAKHVCCPT